MVNLMDVCENESARETVRERVRESVGRRRANRVSRWIGDNGRVIEIA